LEKEYDVLQDEIARGETTNFGAEFVAKFLAFSFDEVDARV